MRDEYLKTLWILRFEKIRKTEEEAAWGYQEILDMCITGLGEKDEAVALLRQLVREERVHVRLGEELLRICYHTHTECGLL